jgi:hypothetical protein
MPGVSFVPMTPALIGRRHLCPKPRGHCELLAFDMPSQNNSGKETRFSGTVGTNIYLCLVSYIFREAERKFC